MDIIKYRAFYTVSTLGSFSRAAETLFFTQPAISAQIKELENEYGAKLFDRIGRNIRLTPAGEALLPYVESLLRTFEESRFALEMLKGTKEGNIKLGVSLLPGVKLVPGLLAEFKQEYPKISFSITANYSAEIRELVERNDLDLGIIGRSPGIDGGIKTVEHLLVKDEIVMVTGKDHPYADKGKVSVSDLSNMRLIVSQKNTVTRQALDKLFRRHHIPFHIEYEIDNKSMIKAMVEKNLGIGFFCAMDVAQEVASGRLISHKIDGEHLYRDIIIIYHRDKEFSPSLKSFVDFLKQHSEEEH